MYTGAPLPDFDAPVCEADKANGFVHLCDQSALMFGSDRAQPVPYRPVVEVRHYLDWVVVLPCTSKQPAVSGDFFALTDSRIMWTKRQERRSFAFYRYEPVAPSHLKAKIGVMHQAARIELLAWLKQRI